MLILLGTHDEYIHSAIFDPFTKSLQLGKTTRVDPHPSWLTRHPRLPDIVYSNSWAEGRVNILRLKDQAGDFDVLEGIDTGGQGLNYLALLPDCSAIIGAHYGSGSAVHIPLTPSGGFDRSKQLSTYHLPPTTQALDHPRQDGPHAHQIVCYKDEILIPDLGSNQVLRQSWDQASGQWVLKGIVGGYIEGDGPRHIAMHPNGRHLYTINELSSTLTSHDLSKGDDEMTIRLSILPPADKDNGPQMLASEILILPAPTADGDHLMLCTNRDSPNAEGDAIALFEVNKYGRSARTTQGWITGVGRHLRGMAADKEGKYVAVAGRDGGGLVIFERGGRKGLELTQVAQIDIDNVVCPLWID